jgi:hypothetical protein
MWAGGNVAGLAAHDCRREGEVSASFTSRSPWERQRVDSKLFGRSIFGESHERLDSDRPGPVPVGRRQMGDEKLSP